MMTDLELELLVKRKIIAGESEWIDRSLALQTLAVLRSVDARLEALNRALASNASGSIAGELRSVSDMLQVVVTKLNR
jgi:hypothetical protein